MRKTTYLILVILSFNSSYVLANNQCSEYLESYSLVTESTSGRSLNSEEIFQRLDGAGPLHDQLKWLAVMAKYPDGTEVLQYGARVILDKLDISLQESLKNITERSSDGSERQKATRLANLDPERIERFYILNPNLRNSSLDQVFAKGIEFLTIVVSDTEGHILGLKTFTSYLPDSVQFTLFDLENIDKFIGDTYSKAETDGKTPLRIDVFHNHPEPEPLSPSDIIFSKFIARKYGLVSEIYAYVNKNGKSYIFVSPIAIGKKVTISD